MIALNPWLPQVSAVGTFLVVVMSVVTLSFLVTTPECWLLVIKDAIMMGAALVTMADSAKAYLRKREGRAVVCRPSDAVAA